METIRLDLSDAAASCAFSNPIYETIDGIEKTRLPETTQNAADEKAREAGFPPSGGSMVAADGSHVISGNNNNVDGEVLGSPSVVTPENSRRESERPPARKVEPVYYTEKWMTRRRLCAHHVLMVLLALLLALGVSLLVAFYLAPKLTSKYSAQILPDAGTTVSCELGNGGCDDKCVERSNAAYCACEDPGLILSKNSKTCTDRDECIEKPCPDGSDCLNTWGSYVCLHTAKEDPGVTYVRWGRSTCPENVDTELVYSGLAGGQHFRQLGGGANYLCLPKEPEWGNYSETMDNVTLAKRNFLSGCEYEKEDKTMFPFSDAHAQVLDDEDAPCAVCRTRRRTTGIMIPARRSCDRGWTLEYWGYLMSEFYEDARSEFVCVDHAPETTGEGTPNLDGVGFFLVLGRCRSLPCPPYSDDKELTCAVCTK